MVKVIQIAEWLEADTTHISNPNANIQHLCIDTRKILQPESSIFFALYGNIHNGHLFIQEALDKGIKNIVVSENPGLLTTGVNVFIVENTLEALQKVAQAYRNLYQNTLVLGITGSNGKTIVKEWLAQLMFDKKIVKSPKSYNSQVGVPLSLWQMSEKDQISIFEAGISKIGEMQVLANMIQPNYGIFTYLGDAHDEGFPNRLVKLHEKLDLFETTHTILYCHDEEMVHEAMSERFPNKVLLSWGKNNAASLFKILDINEVGSNTIVTIEYKYHIHQITLPFCGSAPVHNVMMCVAQLLVFGYTIETIKKRIGHLQNIAMRLEMKNGISNSIIINDTYNADYHSFKSALEFLSLQAGPKEKIVILSEFQQTGLNPNELIIKIIEQIHIHKITHLIVVGKEIKQIEKYLDPFILFSAFDNTEDLISAIQTVDLSNKAILIKGARVFRFEKVAQSISEKIHTSVLETDLQAVDNNINAFSKYLSSNTKLLAVIKASAYGSGSEELARLLEYKKIKYLAVAFIDEGIQLRKAGIELPIIILNPDRSGVMDMLQHNLEPEIYNIRQIDEILQMMSNSNHSFKIHIKIDSGMHRLGFLQDEIPALINLLGANKKNIEVVSIFSHLSSSEDAQDDLYTAGQVEKFNQNYDIISATLGYKPIKHILNTSGIIRFPEYHFDMVRIGLGLYGIDMTGMMNLQLEKVHSLKASVIQIKEIDEGQFIGYNRRAKSIRPMRLAIINIGYADGLMRAAGNGNYKVRIKGYDCPIIGNVCMDLSIVDITDCLDINVGDEVIIFGKDKPIDDLAKVCNTIPYEILTRIAPRIKRLYVHG